MKTWEVPPWDTANKCWVAWDETFGGYYLTTRTPEGDYTCYPARQGDKPLTSVHALMIATTSDVRWGEVASDVLAELHSAPTIAYLEADHESVREQNVALALRLALST